MSAKRTIVAVGVTLVPMTIYACSSNSADSAGSVTPDGGSSNTSSGTSTGGASSSSGSDAGACNDAGTLYSRLGEHSGIRTAVNAVVAAELGNADMKSYFFWQLTPTPGHPSAGQVEECFTDLLAMAAGGPETYPPEGGVSDDGGTPWMCRANMAAIHAPLLISGGTFDEFVTIAAGVLQNAGVQACDIATIGSALESFKPAIVTASLADAGLEPFPGDASPQAGDAGDQ
jgi:hypothetical protein